MADDLFDIDSSSNPDRLPSGVKKRMDGLGDAWSNAHRVELGRNCYLHDVDAVFGCEFWGSNTGEKLFLEYAPDDYKTNRFNKIREFAVVALFDRKSTEKFFFSQSNALSLAFYLWQCRVFAERQPVPPKFFAVIGSQTPPWKMIEFDISSGERLGDEVYVQADNGSFRRIWEQLGLKDLRTELRKWILSKDEAET